MLVTCSSGIGSQFSFDFSSFSASISVCYFYSSLSFSDSDSASIFVVKIYSWFESSSDWPDYVSRSSLSTPPAAGEGLVYSTSSSSFGLLSILVLNLTSRGGVFGVVLRALFGRFSICYTTSASLNSLTLFLSRSKTMLFFGLLISYLRS